MTPKNELVNGLPLTSIKQTYDGILTVITEVIHPALGCYMFVDAVS